MISGSRFAPAGLVRVWSITAAVFIVLAIAMACTARPARREAAQPAPQSGGKSLTLDHLGTRSGFGRRHPDALRVDSRRGC